MVSFVPLLVAREHWDRWDDRRRKKRRRVAYFDDECGICFQICRIFTRFDSLGRVRFVSNRDPGLPKGVTAELTRRTIVVENPRTGRITTRAAAVADLVSALPMALPLAWLLRAPGLSTFGGWIYDRAAGNRVALGRWFGVSRAMRAPASIREPTQARRWWTRWAGRTQTVIVLLFMAIAVGEVARSNSVPRWMQYEQPALFKAINRYGRFNQYWRMFAPDVPKHEKMITVEARTASGRLVDPYNEVASLHTKVPFRAFPKRLAQGEFLANYTKRIAFERYTGYRPMFKRWILAYHERTGMPGDRIVSFKVLELLAASPEPGEPYRPRLGHRPPFMKYRTGAASLRND